MVPSEAAMAIGRRGSNREPYTRRRRRRVFRGASVDGRSQLGKVDPSRQPPSFPATNLAGIKQLNPNEVVTHDSNT